MSAKQTGRDDFLERLTEASAEGASWPEPATEHEASSRQVFEETEAIFAAFDVPLAKDWTRGVWERVDAEDASLREAQQKRSPQASGVVIDASARFRARRENTLWIVLASAAALLLVISFAPDERPSSSTGATSPDQQGLVAIADEDEGPRMESLADPPVVAVAEAPSVPDAGLMAKLDTNTLAKDTLGKKQAEDKAPFVTQPALRKSKKSRSFGRGGAGEQVHRGEKSSADRAGRGRARPRTDPSPEGFGEIGRLEDEVNIVPQRPTATAIAMPEELDIDASRTQGTPPLDITPTDILLLVDERLSTSVIERMLTSRDAVDRWTAALSQRDVRLGVMVFGPRGVRTLEPLAPLGEVFTQELAVAGAPRDPEAKMNIKAEKSELKGTTKLMEAAPTVGGVAGWGVDDVPWRDGDSLRLLIVLGSTLPEGWEHLGAQIAQRAEETGVELVFSSLDGVSVEQRARLASFAAQVGGRALFKDSRGDGDLPGAADGGEQTQEARLLELIEAELGAR